MLISFEGRVININVVIIISDYTFAFICSVSACSHQITLPRSINDSGLGNSVSVITR